MDHIVSFEKGACVTKMYYFKSTAEKTSDLRRWRDLRKNMNGHAGVILFFADGTVFDTFLSMYNDHKYWRHYYRLKKDKTLSKETLLAMYKLKFEKWAKIVRQNGIHDLKETKTLHL